MTKWIWGLATCCLALSATGIAQDIEKLDPNFAVPDPSGEFAWYDARKIGLTGQGWTELAAPYDRLPAKAEGVVRPSVWSLSRHAAGLAVHFKSDSPVMAARWSLRNAELAMPHMPATGVSGLDLYARDGTAWRFVAGARPSQQDGNEARLVAATRGGVQEYLLFLPLYNGVTTLEIGIRPDATLAKPDPPAKKPIVFYGTSITQGGCASRPGMAYPAILGRRLDRPTINLGFSGNGKMEPEMAALLAELDPAVFVLDALPNNTPEETQERLVPLVRTIRAARPDTPIVLVENITYQGQWFSGAPGKRDGNNEILQAAYDTLLAEGMTKLYYIPGDDLLGHDSLGTVDGTHPTDLGFLRQADALEPTLRKALGE
jgi:lysophospholipase L1-like esterase